jgi:hypothetical protein
LGGAARLFLRLFFAALSFSAVTDCQASPWGREPGRLFLISSARYFSADLVPEITPQGPVERRFGRIDSELYTEYGLTRDITAGGKAAYGTSFATNAEGVDAGSGFSEIEFFAQHRLFSSNTDIGAIKLSVTRPSRFQSGARNALVSDGIDADISALYGRNISDGPVTLFITAEGGYRKRFGDAADQIRLHAQAGAKFSSRILFLADAYSEVSLRNEKGDGADYDIIKLQPSLVWTIRERWALQLGMTEEIAGRNINPGRTLFIGLWREF